MQISPLTPIAPVVQPVHGVPASPAWPATTPSRLVAPAAAPAPLAGIVDGVERLIDFPGIAKGDTFDIVKGSKVGFFGVKGTAEILRFDDNGATFHVNAGAFGVKVDVTVDVTQTGPETVRISSHGTGIPDQSADGRIVTSRTNFAEFERIDAPSEHTVISHDGNGGVVIDTVVPTFGNAHLVLQRRS